MSASAFLDVYHDRPAPARPRVSRVVAGTAGLALLAPALQLSAHAGPLVPAARQLPPAAKYVVYMDGQRVGSQTISFTQATFEGEPALLEESTFQVRLVADGDISLADRTQRYVGPDNRLLFLRSTTSARGNSRMVEARYFPDHVECALDANGQKFKQSFPLPQGVTVSPTDVCRWLGRARRVGERESWYQASDGGLGFALMRTEVLRKENLRARGRAVEAFAVQENDDEVDWFTRDGRLLKTEATAIGLKLVRDDIDPTWDVAPSVVSTGVPIVPSGQRIQGALHLTMLRLKATGIPNASMLLSDERQNAHVDDPAEARVITYEVCAALPPRRGAAVVAGPSDDPMLQDDPYLGIGDPAIRKQAKEIAGSETDRAVIARRLRDWVHARITRPAVPGALRDAWQVMVLQAGDCRDFATLFAALARAAGIPTRVCVGLKYTIDGFRWHAWNECRLADGPDGWYAFDATLDGDFVDATHVKFAQGGARDTLKYNRLPATLKIEVIDQR
jgi:hypothetical protein